MPVPTGKPVEIAPGVFFPSVNLGTCCGSDPKVGIPAWFAVADVSSIGVGIDTSNDYSSTGDISPVLAKEGALRGEFFMTSKVHVHRVKEPLTAAYAYRQVEQAVQTLTPASGYVDLMLIHHPASDEENVALWIRCGRGSSAPSAPTSPARLD